MSIPTHDAPRTTLAHLSDVHFGRVADDRVPTALVGEVNAAALDLAVVSGDLTQRARAAEFRQARRFLASFHPPTLVVPGNHDVPGLHHNAFDRLARPTRRYERHISADLTPTAEVPASATRMGTAVFGLNSAHGWTVKGGRIRPADLASMERFFGQQHPATVRVFVLHHHLLRLAALGEHDVSRGAERALDAAFRARVDLVLCGHLHVSHVEAVARDGHQLVIASAGTATSDRGRDRDAGLNTYNWIEIGAHDVAVTERRFDVAKGAFAPLRTTTFERSARTA